MMGTLTYFYSTTLPQKRDLLDLTTDEDNEISEVK